MAKQKQLKTILLFSGGLDSMLALKILEQQKIKAKLLTFTSFFFNAKQAKKSAKILNKKIKIIDISREHLRIVRNPKFGYGKTINPCLDCHLLMLKQAKKILLKEKFDFISTGEIVGQRMMSQRMDCFKLMDKKTGLRNKIFRPLSARILEKTIFEKESLIDREKSLNISGKSRKQQIFLAKKFNIKKYPSPAGGCILTDLNFSKRLKKLFSFKKNISKNDIELLKIGRHFYKDGFTIIIGRNYQENLKLKHLALKSNILIELDKILGPTALIKIKKCSEVEKKEILFKTAKLIKKYSREAKKLNKVKIKYWNKSKNNKKFIEV
ncbi:MAG: tRNA 4-thiouridine(8) synthase ThiI [Patescibacteria group bacterium]|nr:tRNA 4-thiouridine(8) synthase ThiI [Patescibacteria group bacterium]